MAQIIVQVWVKDETYRDCSEQKNSPGIQWERSNSDTKNAIVLHGSDNGYNKQGSSESDRTKYDVRSLEIPIDCPEGSDTQIFCTRITQYLNDSSIDWIMFRFVWEGRFVSISKPASEIIEVDYLSNLRKGTDNNE